MLTCLSNSGGVQNWRRLFDVFRYELVEEFFVSILKTSEIHVLVDGVRSEAAEVVEDTLGLLVDGEYVGRQQAVYPQDVTLCQGECGALQDTNNIIIGNFSRFFWNCFNIAKAL